MFEIRHLWAVAGILLWLVVWVVAGFLAAPAQMAFGLPPWVWPVGLGALIGQALWQYHTRRMARIHKLELEKEGWQRVTIRSGVTSFWVCPYCRCYLPDAIRSTEEHMDPDMSACAAFTERREQQEQRDRIADAEAPPVTAEFAGVRGSPGAGAVDSMSADPAEGAEE